ncbi:polyunsaturated fatty acid lipoxygenase ALOX15B-like [Scomber scombrus]|uniref:Polyunsaturated fatty acid lipoxygenase ALOX15B-like n=1 Tax=Scomber scombrus TaxID=13677 RepID=A0AAV1NG83_SCOSC
MGEYEVTVFTGNLAFANTFNNVFIKLVGTDGESNRTWLVNIKGAAAFGQGKVSSFSVSCPKSIGKLVLIELDKQCLPLFPDDAWFCSKVEVKYPEGNIYSVPIYRWISDSEVHRFSEATALRVFEHNHHLGKYTRQQELKQREKDYRLAELSLKGLADSTENWTDFDSIKRVFCCKRTDISGPYGLLAEVFAVSLLRNMPMVHPLYKLLIPHTRYTLQINLLARSNLISEEGNFTKFASSGGEGMVTILRRSLSAITYNSLCIHDDIAERGLQDVPNFYYRDDGLRLWDIIYRFVQEILCYYYKNDDEVRQDTELQKWIGDIFEHGFLSRAGTGIPQKFSTVAELVKFVTMVLFTCSVQHASVNTGQYDYGAWMPNTPITLKLPPPTKWGTTSEAMMLETFPDVGTTVNGMATMWLLSRQSSDFVPLGQYPEEHFREEIPCKLIKEFQEELDALSAAIKTRNKNLDVPYTYMDPKEIENSVAI